MNIDSENMRSHRDAGWVGAKEGGIKRERGGKERRERRGGRGRRKGEGEEEGGERGGGEKIMMTMMVIIVLDVMMTIDMMVAMVQIITCDVDNESSADREGSNLLVLYVQW